jgi:hypothetical protein
VQSIAFRGESKAAPYANLVSARRDQEVQGGRDMIQGSCLCGGIRFTIDEPVPGIIQCHCSLCRKSSGSDAIATIPIAATQLRWISGEALVRTFARPSGYGASFCGVCGSPAPDPNAAKTRYQIPAGLIDGDPPLRVVEHIFVGSKAQWDTIADDAPAFDAFPPE